MFRSVRARWAACLLVDLTIAAVALVIAYVLRLGFETALRYDKSAEYLATFVLVCGVVFAASGHLLGSWRFFALTDALNILRAVVIAVSAFLFTTFLVIRLEDMPRSVPIITAFIMAGGMISARVAYRIVAEGALGKLLQTRRLTGRPFVIAYGFNGYTEDFIRVANASTEGPIPVGIIEDDKAHRRKVMRGVPVLGRIDDLELAMARLEAARVAVDQIVITDGAMEPSLVSRVLDAASAAGLRVAKLPDVRGALSTSSDNVTALRPVKIEDLIKRSEVRLDVTAIGAEIAGKVIAVTGAGGSIGSEICRQVLSFKPRRMLLVDNTEYNLYQIERELVMLDPACEIIPSLASVAHPTRIRQLFSDVKPDIVFHAAAYKHVPMVEANPIEGVRTNVVGTANTAQAALACGVKAFVMISTDKAVNPESVMGATKRMAEAYCQAHDAFSALSAGGTRFITVRFGNVLWSSGSVVPLFEEQLRRGGPLTVTHEDIKRYFMTIPEAVQLVLSASAYGLNKAATRGKVFVLDMGEPVRIVDLANHMIRLAGLRPNQDIEVRITGLRPGEKLIEELFDPSERVEKTEADRVLQASPLVLDARTLDLTIKDILEACEAGDTDRIKGLLWGVVSRYKVPDTASARVANG